MTESDKPKPDCFGKLEEVFPKSDNGLRESPERCLCHCPFKTDCLRTALARNTEAREEKVDHAYEAGLMTFFERWSRKKQLKKKHPKKHD